MGLRRRRYQRPVCAAAPGRVAHQRLERFRLARSGLHTQAARAVHPRGIEIEAHHVAAGRAQELRGDLADEAQAENCDTLAELWRRPAHALKGDCTHSGGCRQVDRTAVRNAADEVALARHVISMVRLTSAGAGDEVADRQIADALTDTDHLAGRRIAGIPPLRVEFADW